MRNYIYTDRKDFYFTFSWQGIWMIGIAERNPIFKCQAEDILAADELWEADGNRMEINKKGKKKIPAEVTTWSPDWHL